MATSVGQIQLDLGVNSSGFKQQMNGIAKTAKSSAGMISGSLGKIGAAAAAAFSIKAIVSFGKECLKLGSDLAEVQNVVNVTFGSMSDKVNEWAENAMTAYGLSEKVAKEYMGTFGAMSKAFGNTEAMAYDQAEALTGLAADVASFYNLTTDEAFTKLKSVYTGETESLKSLGVVMTQSALDSYAMSHGFGKTTNAMSEQEKVALRLAFVQDKLAGASGDFARTSDGWANQTRVLALRFDALKASIGQGLINVLTPVIKLLNTLLEKLQKVADGFSSLTASIFGNAGGSSTTISETLSDGGADFSEGLADGATSAKAIKKSLAGFDNLNILSSGNSDSGSGSSGGGSTITTQTETTATSNIGNGSDIGERFKKILGDINEKIVKITKITGLDTMWEKASLSVGHLKTGVNNLFEYMAKGIKNNEPQIEQLKTSLESTFETTSKTITTIWGDMWLICSEHFETFTEEHAADLEEFFTNDISIFTGYATTISEIIGDIFEDLSVWWDDSGKGVFDEFLGCIDDVYEWVLKIYNECIAPIVKHINEELDRLWDEHLEPLWKKVLEFISSIWDFIKMLWDNVLKPAVDWVIEYVGPLITDVINTIVDVIGDVFGAVADVIGGIIDSLGGLLDFITGIFTGDWEKAWNGIKKFFKGIWDAIWGIIKGVINLVIDGLNLLWSAIYAVFRIIANAIGGIAKAIGELFGQDDWGWEMPANAPKIPRLATGGYIAANTPQLAIIGDNKHEGEIVAPESKIAEAVAAGFAKVLNKVQGTKQSSTPIVIKIGEEDFWSGFIDYHNSIVKSTGDSPLLV